MGGKEEKRDCQKKKKADGGGRQIGPSRMSDWSLSPDHWVGLVKDDQSGPPHALLFNFIVLQQHTETEMFSGIVENIIILRLYVACP